MPFLRNLIILKKSLCGDMKLYKRYIFEKRKENDRESFKKALLKPNKSNNSANSHESSIISGQKRHDFPAFRLSASMAVEAAIALPIMIFALYILMFPLKVMEAERTVQNSMESAAKKLTVAEYIRDIGEDTILSGSKYETLVGGLIDGFESGLAMASVLGTDELKYFRNAAFSSETSIFSDDDGADSDIVYMKLDYEPAFPSTFFRLTPLNMSIVTNKRAWVGSAGGRGRSKYSGEDSDSGSDGAGTDEETYVYLGKTSTEVYHLDPGCHYLSNNLSSCDASKIDELRNLSGSKYHACATCKPEGSGTVYYSASGTAFHASEDCKAITAYAYSVPLSEVSGMRPCSYCGGGH